MKSVFSIIAPMICASVLLLSPVAHAEKYMLYTEELPPYSFKGGDKRGAAIDIASALFERSGLDYEVKITPWKRAYVTVENTPNTCLFPAQRNQEREASFHWVSPLYISQTAFYGLETDGLVIRTLNDAKGLKIGSYNGSAAAEYLQGWGHDVKTVAHDKQNIMKLSRNRVDLWASDTLSAAYQAKKHNTVLQRKLVYFSTLRALACSLDIPKAIVDKLQAELGSMYGDGTIDKIMADYRK
ncbi:hypothetical protein A9Q99_18955 [Gammaproteobacteria bacterium 45_16_T64]|nr:hypothetical protein A9Q99_18955 [Gammaproteobacteria bacterium 45_16_T64]